MNSCLNEQNVPPCRFGPGGDFVSFWPVESPRSSALAPNQLAKLFRKISEIIGMVAGSIEAAPTAPATVETQAANSGAGRENCKNAHDDAKGGDSSDAAPNRVVTSDSLFSDEPVLFSDHRRTGVRTGHKQKHRIRAYRRTSKKRFRFCSLGQGSLFEAKRTGVRTA